MNTAAFSSVRNHLHLSAILFLLASASFAPSTVKAEKLSPARVYALTCEHLQNPIGIGVAQPRLSWKIRSEQSGEKETAYEIRAASSARNLTDRQADLWDSGKVISDQSVLVPWAGKALGSRAQVYWQVRVRDKDGKPTAWSEPASFELGLLNPASEWKAKWITADLPRYDVEQEALAKSFWVNAGSSANETAAVRLTFSLPSNTSIRNASIDAAGDGLLTLYVNGHTIRQGSSSRTAPLRANILSEVLAGTNIIGIKSAAVRNAVRRDRGEAGRNAIAARVLVELADGRRLEFPTDVSWKAAVAPDGEWFATNADVSSWSNSLALARYVDQTSHYCDNTIGPGRYLRKAFVATKPIARARLYATALGVYDVWLNGKCVNGDCVLSPGWTDYSKRVMVQTYDVTRLLARGNNVLGAVLGDGWYAGRIGWMGLAQYGKTPCFAAQLEITYRDGSTERVTSDESWKSGSGEIIGSDLQWGEIIDSRKATGWSEPSFNDSSWTPAVSEEHQVELDPQRGPPVRQLFELAPKRISQRGDTWLVDFGQNLVGHIRLTAHGSAGITITVRHGEMLNPDGSLYTENLRPALATDTLILSGRRDEFEPRFTFHGFRYAELTGYPGKLSPDALRAVVVGSDTPATGSWECSDTNLNQLYSNIVWGQRGNFLSVPTDCPQRDERMGWMGDAQVFAPTAARNADVAAFFAKWLVDVDDAQSDRGDFANYSPRAAQPQPGWPVWGDAGVIVPWVMYTSYGDTAFLADNYTDMVRWLEYCQRSSKDLILSGGVGDHLAPQRTPTDVVDTAYFANSADLAAKAATVLGKTEDAARWEKLHQDIVAAFNRTFVSTNGVIRGDTQTAYILALQFNLLPDPLRPLAAQRLAENVAEHGHLTTGFVGVGLICPTLTQIGRPDLAWQLLFADSYPSWLFSVKNGATTIWERWDGWTPEKGFQDSSMNSFNHYSFGSVGAWFYSGAGGIMLDESHPGYKHFILRPQFTPRLNFVRATLDSPYGLIVSRWHTEKDMVFYDVTVPPNTSTELILPVPPQDLGGTSSRESPNTSMEVAPGSYHFSFPRRLLK